jgi:cobaltochelatase CobT
MASVAVTFVPPFVVRRSGVLYWLQPTLRSTAWERGGYRTAQSQPATALQRHAGAIFTDQGEAGVFGLQRNWLDLALLIFIVALAYLPPLRKFSRLQPLFDPGRPYQAYCRDFDVEVAADKLDSVLAAAPDADRQWAVRFPDVGPRGLPEIEQDLAARRASRAPALQEAAARISAAAGHDVLNDTIVSLLIDHSGSMRGQPILSAAHAATAASDLLDGLGARQEVLGFTTVRWKGGRSREKWLQDGRPPCPGRLNDLLHIVYCSAGERLHARHCAAMLRKDLLKENIDGEAIEWAASRLRQRGESHKYLIVVSDGAPVDDSTLLENGNAYMERHLLGVIGAIARAGDIRLAAIGIGYDVGRYYARSVAITTLEELDGAVLQIVEELLCPHPASSPDSQSPDPGPFPQ